MKTRSGFVSNSSSSSFVVIGTRIPKKELEVMGWYDEWEGNTDKIPKGVAVYYDESDEGYIVGIPLCESQEWGLSEKELTYKDVQDILMEASSKLNNRPIKLMMGTRPT